MQHRFQHRQQMLLADARRAADDLPLRDGVHSIDAIDALLAFPIALVHDVHP
jgi:hypothetical protein